MSLTESLPHEWLILLKLVTAAVLVAVVYPQFQSVYQRLSQPSTGFPSFSASDYAYAASAVLRPGQASTLRYGDESQEPTSDALPIILRKFKDLSLSDSEEESTAQTLSSPSETEHPHTDSTPRRSAIKKKASALPPPAPFSDMGSLSASPGGVRFTTPPVATTRASTPARLTFEGEVIDAPLAPPRTAELTFKVPLTDMMAAMQTSDNAASAAKAARAASAPPSALAPPKPFHLPTSKTKAKPKAPPSSGSRATSTPPSSAPPSSAPVRPLTRSMSTAPGRSAYTAVAVINGDIPPAESYIRRSTKHASWFESRSKTQIGHPPDFSTRQDVELEDVFIHWANDAYQLWVWEEDAAGNAVWKRVWLGYARPSDGRQLSVTPSRKQPSWISQNWSLKTAKKRAA